MRGPAIGAGLAQRRQGWGLAAGKNVLDRQEVDSEEVDSVGESGHGIGRAKARKGVPPGAKGRTLPKRF